MEQHTKLVVVAQRSHERPWVIGPFDTEERARAAADTVADADTDVDVCQLIEPDPELQALWP